MEVGHIFKIDDTKYCICDIKIVEGKTYACTISGQGESTKFTFFELMYSAEGVLINEVVDDKKIAELFVLFSENLENIGE